MQAATSSSDPSRSTRGSHPRASARATTDRPAHPRRTCRSPRIAGVRALRPLRDRGIETMLKEVEAAGCARPSRRGCREHLQSTRIGPRFQQSLERRRAKPRTCARRPRRRPRRPRDQVHPRRRRRSVQFTLARVVQTQLTLTFLQNRRRIPLPKHPQPLHSSLRRHRPCSLTASAAPVAYASTIRQSPCRRPLTAMGLRHRHPRLRP